MLHFAAAYNAPAEATQLVLDAGPEAAKVRSLKEFIPCFFNSEDMYTAYNFG